VAPGCPLLPSVPPEPSPPVPDAPSAAADCPPDPVAPPVSPKLPPELAVPPAPPSPWGARLFPFEVQPMLMIKRANATILRIGNLRGRSGDRLARQLCHGLRSSRGANLKVFPQSVDKLAGSSCPPMRIQSSSGLGCVA
jgi:hypothetical protein